MDRSDLSYFYSGIMKVSEASLDPFTAFAEWKALCIEAVVLRQSGYTATDSSPGLVAADCSVVP
jgi:hypothetical protein